MFRSAVSPTYSSDASPFRRIVPRGVITANCYTNNKQMENRETTYNMAGNSLFKFPKMDAPGDSRHGVHIRQCAGLVTFKMLPDDAVSMMSQESQQFYPIVFSSWNGFVVEGLRPNATPVEEYAAQQRMYDQFLPFGFAETTYTYNEASQPDTGMTSRVNGSFSVMNTGLKTFHPGHRIVASFPPCGTRAFSEFQEKQRVAHGSDAALFETPTVLEPLDSDVGGKHLVLMAAAKLYDVAEKSSFGFGQTAASLAQYFADNPNDVFVRLCNAVENGGGNFDAKQAILNYGAGNTTSLNPLLDVAGAFADFQQQIADRIVGVALSHAEAGGQVIIAS